jgi:hypothetical protein
MHIFNFEVRGPWKASCAEISLPWAAGATFEYVSYSVYIHESMAANASLQSEYEQVFIKACEAGDLVFLKTTYKGTDNYKKMMDALFKNERFAALDWLVSHVQKELGAVFISTLFQDACKAKKYEFAKYVYFRHKPLDSACIKFVFKSNNLPFILWYLRNGSNVVAYMRGGHCKELNKIRKPDILECVVKCCELTIENIGLEKIYEIIYAGNIVTMQWFIEYFKLNVAELFLGEESVFEKFINDDNIDSAQWLVKCAIEKNCDIKNAIAENFQNVCVSGQTAIAKWLFTVLRLDVENFLVEAKYLRENLWKIIGEALVNRPAVGHYQWLLEVAADPIGSGSAAIPVEEMLDSDIIDEILYHNDADLLLWILEYFRLTSCDDIDLSFMLHEMCEYSAITMAERVIHFYKPSDTESVIYGLRLVSDKHEAQVRRMLSAEHDHMID